MLREAAASALSGAVFVGSMGVLLLVSQHGYTRIYHDPAAHGTAWFVASIACMLFLHDAYFYWTHRLRHESRLFWRAHRLHHAFRSPTPWAAFASSPAEALIEAGVLPLIVWTIPVHPAALFCFTSIMTAQSVALHCGFELRLGRRRSWWMGSRAHHDHHQGVRGNYGLYTTLWDVAMGTYVEACDSQENPDLIQVQHASVA
jgi:sterol desaturase/sphingolipid hydroxylase (fatty acid hydroxylase superfamily)